MAQVGIYGNYGAGGVVVYSQDTYYTPEMFGAVGDGVTDDTAAMLLAIAACGANNILHLKDSIYNVTSTPGNFALTARCPIKGNNPKTSIIYNSGTGSCLKLEGVAGDIYYTRFQNFAVQGNAASEDGISLNPDGDINEAVAYSVFENVDSHHNGRNGLVHRASWATKYIGCKCYLNGGLGIYLITTGADTSFHNNVAFKNCESRWNGGIGDKTLDYFSGGIRIEGHTSGVYWDGGVIESNNAWAVLIADGTGAGVPVSMMIDFRGVYMENTPMFTSASTLGGIFRISGKYKRVTVTKGTLVYGADVGSIGYCFYLVNGAEANSYFKEYDNETTPTGGGTAIRDFGLKSDWVTPYISKTISPGVITILTSSPLSVLPSGGFSAPELVDWPPSDCTAASIAGGVAGNCLEITRTGAVNQGVYQTFGNILTIGETYTASVWIKSGTSGNEQSRLMVFDPHWVGVGVRNQNTTGAWARISVSFVATHTDGIIGLVKNTATAGTMLFDSCSIVLARSWAINGLVRCKKDDDATGGIYPFVAGDDPLVPGGPSKAIGASLVGAATTPPTLAWVLSGWPEQFDLQATIAALHSGHVEISIGGAELDPPEIFLLNPVIFCDDLVKRRQD